MSITVDKCCFCASLRTGAISVACIWLLGDTLILAGMSFVTYLFNQLMLGDFWNIIVLGPFWMAAVFDVLYSVAILLDIILLVGANTGRRALLSCWMVGYLLLYVLILLFCGITLAAMTPHDAISFTAILLVHAGLMVYFWIVVRSYYLELGQQQSEGTLIPTAGKVFNTVPTGEVPPAQDIYSQEGGFAELPTAPPPYTSSSHQPLCYSETTPLSISC